MWYARHWGIIVIFIDAMTSGQVISGCCPLKRGWLILYYTFVDCKCQYYCESIAEIFFVCHNFIACSRTREHSAKVPPLRLSPMQSSPAGAILAEQTVTYLWAVNKSSPRQRRMISVSLFFLSLFLLYSVSLLHNSCVHTSSPPPSVSPQGRASLWAWHWHVTVVPCPGCPWLAAALKHAVPGPESLSG